MERQMGASYETVLTFDQKSERAFDGAFDGTFDGIFDGTLMKNPMETFGGMFN